MTDLSSEAAFPQVAASGTRLLLVMTLLLAAMSTAAAAPPSPGVEALRSRRSGPPSTAPFVFPPGFLWGSATAAHQVEGNNSNCDWWDWEQIPGHIRNNERSGWASDHYRLFGRDLAEARRMKHNAYRLSIEWARLEPEEGRFDEQEVAHYRAVLEACRANGLKPMVTLFHFTLPRWVLAKGGWLDRRTIDYFARFAAFAGSRFGDLADLWCTLNEPVVYLGAAYGLGVFPPGVKDMNKAFAVMANLAKGHATAFKSLKATDSKDADGDGKPCLVSVAHHMRVFDPARHLHPIDIVAARVTDFIFNRAFMQAITKGRLSIKLPGFPWIDVEIPGGIRCLDFLGVNYYSRDLIRFNPKSPILSDRLVPAGAPVSDMGWEIYAEGFYRVLMTAWKDYKLPIVVTENGIADAADTKREAFLLDHVRAMARAMRDGVPVLGYLHWSLIDNFEWAEGFTPRFGLLTIDYATQERRPTKAAAAMTRIIEAGSIELSKPRAAALDDLPDEP